MECICHITVALKLNYSCGLEEAMAQCFSTLARELEAHGSWKAAATLWAQDAISPLRIALERVLDGK